MSDAVAREVARAIQAGTIRNLDEVVMEGLASIESRGATVDIATLRRAVLPVIDAMDRDPARAVPAAEAWASINAYIAHRRGAD